FQGIIIDNLDVVGAFGNAHVHKGLGLVGAGNGGDVDAVLGPVSSGGGDQNAGRAKIGLVGKFAGSLVFFNRLAVLDIAEHVQFGRNAKGKGLREMRGTKHMDVTINQSGKQGKAVPGDYLSIRRFFDQAADQLDFAVFYKHIE